MDKKEPDKPHNLCMFQQVCTTVQISVARPEDSIIKRKAFVLTWIDSKHVGGQKIKATAVNIIYLENPSPGKSLGFIAVNKSMRNSKEPWQKLLLLILSQVDQLSTNGRRNDL